jgi:hypothetical protein
MGKTRAMPFNNRKPKFPNKPQVSFAVIKKEN